jgi:trigger factor
MNLQVYLGYTGMEMDSFRKTFRDQAERQVKIRLALAKIAQLEGIEVSEEEITKEYERVAELYEVDMERVRAIFPEKDVIADAKSSKAIDLVRENANITEAPAPDPTAHDHDHEHDHDHDHE